jgi:hypothetical protein
MNGCVQSMETESGESGQLTRTMAGYGGHCHESSDELTKPCGERPTTATTSAAPACTTRTTGSLGTTRHALRRVEASPRARERKEEGESTKARPSARKSANRTPSSTPAAVRSRGEPARAREPGAEAHAGEPRRTIGAREARYGHTASGNTALPGESTAVAIVCAWSHGHSASSSRASSGPNSTVFCSTGQSLRSGRWHAPPGHSS